MHHTIVHVDEKVISVKKKTPSSDMTTRCLLLGMKYGIFVLLRSTKADDTVSSFSYLLENPHYKITGGYFTCTLSLLTTDSNKNQT